MRRFADYALCCFGLEVGKKIAPGHFEPFPQKRTEKQMKKRNKNKIKMSKVD